MLKAVALADLPQESQAWQAVCSSRLQALGPPSGKRRQEGSYTIRHERMAAWARDTLWDTTDRDDCVPLRPSTGTPSSRGRCR